MRPGNISSDYYIYFDENKGAVIDLFYAKDLFSLSNVVNIKLKRYVNLPYETYFVLVGNESIKIEDIRKMIINRKIPLPSQILVDTEQNFKSSTILKLKKKSKFSRN